MDHTTGLKRNVTVYYISNALSGLLFTIPVWVAFHQQYLDYSQLAFIAGLSYFVTLILELPTGALADLIGRKRTIIIGQVLIGVFRIFLGFSFAPWMFYVAWLGEAAGNAFVSGADKALLYDSLKECGDEKKFPGIVAKSSLVRRALMVAAVLSGGYLYQYFEGLPFILRGLAYMVMAIVSVFLIEPDVESYKFTLKNYTRQAKKGFIHLLRTPYLKSLTAYYTVVVGIIWVCQDYFVNTFAKDSGYTEKEQSWVFASLYLISTLVVLFLTRNESKIMNKKLLYVSMAAILIVSLVPGYYASKLVVYFLIFGLNLTSAMQRALLDNYVNEELESKYRATAMSGLNLLVSGVYMAVLFISGPFQDEYSNRFVWSALGIAAVLLLVPLTTLLLSRLKAKEEADRDIITR
ncbi:MAG: MFS transporter [Candidatus Dojkabacteria bacterium]|nr:MAG: MFS transporter [Candidatus Dojkabacteria bacterium]